mmetsp:Transcript_40881/g.61243  ORF Transcript_40881/g.61243 Transcript_40881/m.61243 type:complete len:99 (-) Transcript_40881:616-912(-)
MLLGKQHQLHQHLLSLLQGPRPSRLWIFADATGGDDVSRLQSAPLALVEVADHVAVLLRTETVFQWTLVGQGKCYKENWAATRTVSLKFHQVDGPQSQ